MIISDSIRLTCQCIAVHVLMYISLSVVLHIVFPLQYSVVQLVDRRPVEQQTNRLFFIFFEWKNNIVEESRELYTTTPWSMGAGLCGVFLTLHKAYQLAQESYKRVQKDKARRSMRRQTLRRMTTEDHSDGV